MGAAELVRRHRYVSMMPSFRKKVVIFLSNHLYIFIVNGSKHRARPSSNPIQRRIKYTHLQKEVLLCERKVFHQSQRNLFEVIQLTKAAEMQQEEGKRYSLLQTLPIRDRASSTTLENYNCYGREQEEVKVRMSVKRKKKGKRKKEKNIPFLSFS
jgi:hypothetical protein